MKLTSYFGRVATFTAFEHQIQVQPDIWDVEKPSRLSETVNKFLDDNQVGICLPVSYDVKLIEQRDNGRQRIYLHTMAIVYIPKEQIKDDITAEEKEEKEDQVAAELEGTHKFGDVNDLGRFLQRLNIDPNAFANAVGNVPVSFGGSPAGPAPTGVPLSGPGRLGGTSAEADRGQG